ncbi:hypothetical protein M406DRAFT_68125, partial [Cryphonectria parasitica EP155]
CKLLLARDNAELGGVDGEKDVETVDILAAAALDMGGAGRPGTIMVFKSCTVPVSEGESHVYTEPRKAEQEQMLRRSMQWRKVYEDDDFEKMNRCKVVKSSLADRNDLAVLI